MRLTTFLCLAALFAAIAFCRVQETARQARLQYRLAAALRQEEALAQHLEDVRAREAQLLQAPRLLTLKRTLPQSLAPLRPAFGPGEPRP